MSRLKIFLLSGDFRYVIHYMQLLGLWVLLQASLRHKTKKQQKKLHFVIHQAECFQHSRT